MNEDLKYEDYLISLIMMLDTPVYRRKCSDDINMCVKEVRNGLIEQGLIKEDE